MTILETMQRLEAPLNAWAVENKGRAQIAGDMSGLFSALHALSLKPGGVHVFLVVPGGDNRSEYAEHSREDLRVAVVISRGNSFTLARADSLTRGSAGGRPLFDLAEEVREVVRSVRLDHDEPIPYYTGFKWFDGGEMTIDAYQIDFRLSHDLPQHTVDSTDPTEEDSDV